MDVPSHLLKIPDGMPPSTRLSCLTDECLPCYRPQDAVPMAKVVELERHPNFAISSKAAKLKSTLGSCALSVPWADARVNARPVAAGARGHHANGHGKGHTNANGHGSAHVHPDVIPDRRKRPLSGGAVPPAAAPSGKPPLEGLV